MSNSKLQSAVQEQQEKDLPACPAELQRDFLIASERLITNDKGAVSAVLSGSKASALSVLIDRRRLLLLGLGTALTACVPQLGPSTISNAKVFERSRHYRQNILIRWGEPLWSGMADASLTALGAAEAKRRFGYNNDFITFLPLPFGSNSSEHGLLVVNHEYPIPHLMFNSVRAEQVPSALTPAQIAATLESVGLSVVEVRREQKEWNVVVDSPFNRRITATTPIRISGPAAGHKKLQTQADPSGRLVLGTHDNCNGGVTPWGTVLSGEEGSQDFFGGDIRSAPDYDLLARYHYDQISPEGNFGWPRIDVRFDITQTPNEPNRFEWVVEIDPFEPDAEPIKRTALGRFAHEGAHCALAPDGRVVVYMGDDWEFEYCYKFVTAGRFDPINRKANKHLLDEGVLFVAHFSVDGEVEWLPLIFGQGPLTRENGFDSQGDVMIQTRRAADLLGATPMDCPEGYMPDPHTGKVYIALTGNDERTLDNVNPANPRGPNHAGHLLELIPPDNGNGADHAAERFTWQVKIVCDEDMTKAEGFHSATTADGYFFAPDNINFDPQGNMWVCSDGPNKKGEDGLWSMPTTGLNAWRSQLFFRPPMGAECCGPAFTPDGLTMFVAIQHPSGDSRSIGDAMTHWPDFVANEPPRPSVIVVTWEKA